MPPAFSQDFITSSPLAAAFDATCRQLDSKNFARALWQKQLDVWSADRATQAKIAHRLGWLDALEVMTPQLDRIRSFADSVRRDRFTDVVLLGMGGSSLAPEVMRLVIGPSPGWPRFRVLDSVDPEAVRDALANAGASLFVLASKSGTTIEPNALAAEAVRRVVAAGHQDWETRFVAITDADTALHRRALTEHFRDVFVNPGDIGGRYSALSFFGLVPAALMGIDLDTFLEHTRTMQAACRLDRAAENPGLALGAFMAAAARNKRDKLMLVLPPRLESFGLWVEQLVAESTGKQGVGIVPVTGDSLDGASPGDRFAVTLSVGSDEPAEAGQLPPGLPHVELRLASPMSLGAEFLRWEVATATAGHLMGINPFDEPNVRQAKENTSALLDLYRDTKRLPALEADASVQGAQLTLSESATVELEGKPALAFLRLLRPGDYFSILAYLPPDDSAWRTALTRFRHAIGARGGWATTLGYGPRYLHSTGQLHKGGAPNGVFLVLIAEAAEDFGVPGESYSFSVLQTAQALGDFQTLDRANRRALLVRLPRRDIDTFEAIAKVLLSERES